MLKLIVVCFSLFALAVFWIVSGDDQRAEETQSNALLVQGAVNDYYITHGVFTDDVSTLVQLQPAIADFRDKLQVTASDGKYMIRVLPAGRGATFYITRGPLGTLEKTCAPVANFGCDSGRW